VERKKQAEQSRQSSLAQIEEQKEILLAEKFEDNNRAKANWESVYGFEFKDEIIKRQNPDRILRKQTRTVSSKGGNM